MLVAARDLEAESRRLFDAYGLEAIAGGRHPGVGTANMIVPLGDTYLELITVVDADEARNNLRSIRVTRALDQGRTFVTWAARTEALDALRRGLAAAGRSVFPIEFGSRVRADGRLLRWRTMELAPPEEDSCLPFCIQWDVAPDDWPGRSASYAGDAAMTNVLLGHPDPDAARRELHELLETAAGFTVAQAATPGVTGVELVVAGARLTIR